MSAAGTGDRPRVGVVGTTSTHADHLVRLLNGRAGGRSRVVTTAWDRAGAVQGGGERLGVAVARSLEALIDEVDLVLALDRDTDARALVAREALARGLPVFVDKPLAESLADGRALTRLADEAGTALVSASALRWCPEVPELRSVVEQARSSGPCTVTVRGPADPACPWGGLWFYGIHAAEVACAVAGVAAPDALDAVVADGWTVGATAGNVVVRVELVPGPPGSAPFQVAVHGGGATVARELTVGPDYMAPVADLVLRTATTRAQVVPLESPLAPVRLLEELVASRAADRE